MSHHPEGFPDQKTAIEIASGQQVGIVHQVGEETVAVITRLNPTEQSPRHVGNVLRRTCIALGEGACAHACALRGMSEYPRNPDKLCADLNLKEGLQALGVQPSETLMVAVTGNKVGFGDQLEECLQEDRDRGKPVDNPEGWHELPGYNAFFARPGEVKAIGSRLGDCAHIEFELYDHEGRTVIGFEHGTRTNMFGKSEYQKDGYPFNVDGKPVSYTHYALASAIEHYGADPESFKIRISSSIRAENFVKNFRDAGKMESHIPGWYADGFARNISNPDWKPGDLVVPGDIWHADARGLILRDTKEAMEALGIPPENLIMEGMIDPADRNGEFSSHQNSLEHGDSRDLYLVAHRSAFRRP